MTVARIAVAVAIFMLVDECICVMEESSGLSVLRAGSCYLSEQCKDYVCGRMN